MCILKTYKTKKRAAMADHQSQNVKKPPAKAKPKLQLNNSAEMGLVGLGLALAGGLSPISSLGLAYLH